MLPPLLADATPDGYISVATVAALIVAILGAAGAAGWKVNKTAREKGAEEERPRLKTDTLISPTPLPIVKHPEYIPRDEHSKLELRVSRLEKMIILLIVLMLTLYSQPPYQPEILTSHRVHR